MEVEKYEVSKEIDVDTLLGLNNSRKTKMMYYLDMK